MRIERISGNKIKVLVNRDDVRAWNVSLKNFTDNTPEAQDLFWFALKQAERDVDFNVGKAQLLVETLATTNDGFVMIISKIENESEIAEALVKSGKSVKMSELRLCRRPKPPLLRVFRFESFDALCDGVAEINGFYIGESRLFKYDGSFYLEMKPQDTFGFFEIENILSEFAERVKRPVVTQGILDEHGTVMIETDAVGIILKNFIK